MNSNLRIHRALVFQGGGSLGAYEVSAYEDINEELSRYLKAQGRESEPIFHIVSGTSIGAINAAILVSYVKENKTWEGSGDKLVEFWNYLSKTPLIDNRFFDPSNTWYIYDNKPLKESLEKFAKFPISTSFEKGEPRLLLVAADVQEGSSVVFATQQS